YTVTDLTSHDINTSVTNYKYADILIHPGRGILGFKKTIVENDVSKLKSESILDYDSHYFPFVKETKTYNTAANQQVTHTVNNINFTQGSIPGTFYQQLTSQTENNLLSGAVTTTTNTYDNYGNVTESVTDINGVENIK